MPAKWWVMIFRLGCVSMILEYTSRSIAQAVSYDQPMVHQISYSDCLLVEIIRRLGAARRMQPDRRAELVHLFPERQVFRAVERLAGDVGVNLHAERAEFLIARSASATPASGAASETCATQPGK